MASAKGVGRAISLVRQVHRLRTMMNRQHKAHSHKSLYAFAQGFLANQFSA